VLPGDRAEDLAARAKAMEGEVFVRAIRAILNGRIRLDAPGEPIEIVL
jgi:folate-dependent phosphoribosylglycinamide formyltransferase PurN